MLANAVSRKVKFAPDTKFISTSNARTSRRSNSKPILRNASAGTTLNIAPASSSLVSRTKPPVFRSRTARSTRITHRELIAQVSGTVAFTATQFAINPGMSSTFPWLSTQASSWEQYKFHRLAFCYESRCSSATNGTCILAPDYDAADTTPTSEVIASSYADTTEAVPWTTKFSCALNPNSMLGLAPRKYVRTEGLADNLDVKTYDSGNMYLCTTDGTATNWGKLYVEYDVELFVPQLNPTGSLQVDAYHSQNMGAVTTASPFGVPLGPLTGSDPLLFTTSGSVITFLKSGTFFVSIGWLAAVATPAIPTTTGAFRTQYGQIADGYNVYGSGSTFACVNILVSIVAGQTLTTACTLTAGTSCEIVITNTVPSLQ